MENNLALKCQRAFLNYYETAFLMTLKAFSRPFFFGVILLIIKCIWNLSLLVSKQSVLDISQKDQEFKDFDFIVILKDYDNNVPVLITFLIINTFFIFLCILFFSLHIAGVPPLKSSLLISSLIGQTYNYCILTPSLFYSLKNLNKSSLSFPNLLLTVFIGTLISLHDSDFSFRCNDSLSRRHNNLMRTLILAVEMIQIAMYSFLDNKEVSQIFGIAIGLLRAVTFHEFRVHSIAQINLFFSILSTLAACTFLGFSYFSTSTSIVVVLLLILSFSFGITKVIFSWYYQPQRLKSKAFSKKIRYLDMHLRSILTEVQVEFEKYRTQPISLILEEIIVLHIKNCKQFPYCFCNQKEEDTKTSNLSLLSGKLKRRYAIDYAYRLFLEYSIQISKKKISRDLNIELGYLSFVYEIQLSNLLFYSELIKINTTSQSSVDKCFANFIKSTAKEFFEKLQIASSRAYQSEIDSILDQKKRQESFKDKNIQMADLKVAFSFDESVSKADKNFFNLLENKKSILLLLDKDFVKLETLKKEAIHYFKVRKALIVFLKQLNTINPHSESLNYVINGYCQILGFGVERKSIFSENSKDNEDAKKNNQTSNQILKQLRIHKITKENNKLDIFSKDTCIIFISMVNKPGTIKKVQNTFYHMFGYSKAETINKDISLITPRIVGQYHLNMLIDYFHGHNQLYGIRQNKFRMIIAQDKKGWAIPVSIHFKPEENGNDDCGLIGYIERLHIDGYCIMVGREDMRIDTMSKELYQLMFSDFCKPSDINKIKLLRMIPLLKYLEQKSFQESEAHQQQHLTEEEERQMELQQARYFETAVFIPKNDALTVNQRFWFSLEGIHFEQVINHLESINIQDFNIYRIQLRLSTKQTRYFIYHTIEVGSFIKANSSSAIRENFLLVQSQLKSLLNVHLTFEKHLSTLNYIESNLSSSSLMEDNLDIRDDEPRLGTVNELISYEDYPVLFENVKKFKADRSHVPPQKDSTFLSIGENNNNISNNTNILGNNNNNASNFNSNNNLSNLNNNNITNNKPLMLSDLEQKHFEEVNNISQDVSYIHRCLGQPPQTNRHLQEDNEFDILSSPMTSSRQMLFSKISQKHQETNMKKLKKDVDQLDLPELTNKASQRSSTNHRQSASTLAPVKEISDVDKKSQQNQLQPSLVFSPMISSMKSKSSKPQLGISKKSESITRFEQSKDAKNEKEKQFWKDISDNLSRGSPGRKDKLNGSEDQGSSNKNQVSPNYTIRKQATGDGSSTRQASTISQVSRKNICKSILGHKNNFFLVMLKIYGTSSFLLIFGMTISVYIEMLNQINIAFTTFQYIPWPLTFRANYSLSSNYQAILQTIKRDTFPNNPRLNSDFEALLKVRSETVVASLKDIILQYVRGDKNNLGFFIGITSTAVNFIYTSDLNVIPVSQQLVNNPLYKRNIEMNLEYYLQTSVGYIYRFATLDPNLSEQIVRLDNVSYLFSNITQIDSEISDQCNRVLNEMEMQSQVLMIADILVTISLILAIFPIYHFLQFKNEKILKLFATLLPQNIDEMLKPVNLMLLDAFKSQKISSNLLNNYQVASQRRRKNHCQTNKLPKYKKLFFVVSLLFFVVLVIQPIFNYVQIISFSSEIRKDIQLTRVIYGLRPKFVSVIALTFSYLMYQLDSTYALYNIPYYVKRVPSSVSDNSDQIASIMYAVGESNEQTNRYRQEEFNQFFYKMFEGNVCEALRDYHQYVSDEDEVEFTYCQSIRSGKLQDGLSIALKDVQQEFQFLSEILFITDYTSRSKAIHDWEEKSDLKDFDDYYTLILASVTSIKTFLIQKISDELLYNQFVQSILFALQCTLLSLVFYFGWLSFYMIIAKDMHLTKKLLSIINIEIVLENPYITNYLNEQ